MEVLRSTYRPIYIATGIRQQHARTDLIWYSQARELDISRAVEVGYKCSKWFQLFAHMIGDDQAEVWVSVCVWVGGTGIGMHIDQRVDI